MIVYGSKMYVMPDWKIAKLYIDEVVESCIALVQQEMENNVVTSLSIAHLYFLFIL